jgi:hypothetical protein
MAPPPFNSAGRKPAVRGVATEPRTIDEYLAGLSAEKRAARHTFSKAGQSEDHGSHRIASMRPRKSSAMPLNGETVSSSRRLMWICPRCGARLVTRNLWHSCGRFTLNDLFGRSDPSVLHLAKRFVRMPRSLGDVQVIPQKTRLVCVARVRFAGPTPRRDHFVASFALHWWLNTPRVSRTQDYGPRWRAYSVPIRSASDLDDELRAWLQESHDIVGMQRDVRRAQRSRA